LWKDFVGIIGDCHRYFIFVQRFLWQTWHTETEERIGETYLLQRNKIISDISLLG